MSIKNTGKQSRFVGGLKTFDGCSFLWMIIRFRYFFFFFFDAEEGLQPQINSY